MALPRSAEDPTAAARFDAWRAQIERSIVAAAGGPRDALLNQGVAAAVDAFVDSQDDVRRAASAVAPLLEEIGEREARRGVDTDDLAATFRAALVTAQKGLAVALGDRLTRDELVQARQHLASYLDELHRQTRSSLVRSRQLHAMTREQRRDLLGAVALGHEPAAELTLLATIEGFDPAGRVRTIVSVSERLPDRLRQHAQTIAGPSGRELLLPESWDVGALASELTGQAASGPPVPLARAHEAVGTTRQAASLLRAGTATDDRPLVPCADLLGELIVGGQPLLTEMAIDKHLPALTALPLARRVLLGEVALAMLETGLPLDRVARMLGIPRQTAHSRMKTLRIVVGPAIDDPSQRIELLVALRGALPRWRATARD